MRRLCVLTIFIGLFSAFFIFALLTPSKAGDDPRWGMKVEIDVVTDDGRNIQPDTLVVGGFYKMRIFIENNFQIYGMTTGYRMWPNGDVLWKYTAQEEGHGPIYSSITVNPMSRMWPVDFVFDAEKKLIVQDFRMDLEGADTIFIGGLALHKGLTVGPLEHMLSWHFRVTGPPTNGDVGTLCFDSAFVPPYGTFAFFDNEGWVYIPEWSGQICLPVKAMCGNVNGDMDVNVGDAIFMLNTIFKNGPYMTPLELCDVNCDGQANVGDAVYLLNYIFKFGPEPCCM
jgi:hypothetical protein